MRLTILLICALPLATSNAAEAPHGNAATPRTGAAVEYRIDPCPTPFELRLDGLPALPPTRYAASISTCGDVDMPFPFDAAGLEQHGAEWAPYVPRAARVVLKTTHGTIDLRVELRDGPAAGVYEAHGIHASGATGVPLVRTAGDASAVLHADVKALNKLPFVGLHVVDAPSSRLARDVSRAKGIAVKHIELLGERRSTFSFDGIPVYTVLQLLAPDGIDVQHDGRDAFVVGRVAHFEEIGRLREAANTQRAGDDTAQLKATLERIIALGTMPVAGELSPFVDGEQAELAEIASNAGDEVRAEALYRDRLVQLERQAGTTDYLDYGLALADVGRTLMERDRPAARVLLQRALALIEKHEGRDGASSARVLTNLATLAYQDGRADEAEHLNARATHILENADSGEQWRALRAAGALERRIALDHVGRKDYAAAQPHAERALMLEGAWTNGSGVLVDMDRALLVDVLRQQGKDDAARQLLRQQGDACDAAKPSESCAHAWFELTLLDAAHDAFASAVDDWRNVVALRSVALGVEHARVVAAKQDLLLLQRLAGQPDATPIWPARLQVPSSNELDAKLPFRLRAELSRNLALELSSLLAQDLKSRRRGGEVDAARLAALEEHLAEAQAAAGDRDGAAEEFEAAWALRLNTQGACGADTRRLAARLVALYATQGESRAQGAQHRYNPQGCAG